MDKHVVAISHYEEKIKSVEKVLNLSRTFQDLKGDEKVFLKPNIVYWGEDPSFPKYGVITTSRVIEDVIIYLQNNGIKDITLGEGIVTSKVNDLDTARNAFEYLGYNRFKKKYGIKVLNIFEKKFEKVDIGDDITLNYSIDALNCDLIVSLPVLKTHSQTKTSLGIKNLKGLIDVSSRKKCHSPDLQNDLEFYISRLTDKLPTCATVIDGIYTNERGPGPEGTPRRSNLLIASSDIFSADKVGSLILGYTPSEIPYLNYYAQNHERPLDLSDVEIVGKSIEDVKMNLKYKFPYTDDGLMPLAYQKQGIKGVNFKEYDNSLCTYCTLLVNSVVSAIPLAWKGEAFEDIEFILGKRMDPTPGMKKTILLGQCMVNKHRNNPNINEAIPIKGCPAKIENIKKALMKAGVDINPEFIENAEKINLLTGQIYKHDYKIFRESFFNDEIIDDVVPPIDTAQACHLIIDENNNLKERTHFEIRFFGIIGAKRVDVINNISIKGQDGYELQFIKQKFDFNNGNGYIIDNLNRGIVRFVAQDKNGFLKEGIYEFIVEYANGEVRTKSVNLLSNHDLIKQYKRYKDNFSFSFEQNYISNEQAQISGNICWNTLKKYKDKNAFYVNYISEGREKHINFHDLTFEDDIFLMSTIMPSYGLNKDCAFVYTRWKPLKTNTEYSWMTEICDSNKFDKVNLRILQPTQYFKTTGKD
ncbi:MAG: DUF362 domain-containing protein [Promethearchaeota archaeon]